MAVSASATGAAPRWPSDPIDPARVDVDYYPPADEPTVYFPDRPRGGVCDSISVPGFDDVAVIHDHGSGEVVGVQVIPLLLGAVKDQPEWAALAWAALAGDLGAELLGERLPGFLAEVADAFGRYWTPPPPMDEQLARLTRAERPAAP